MRPDRAGLGITVALHALVVFGLLSYEPARKALLAAAPIMVELISPPKAEPKTEPPTELPRPKPVRQTPLKVEPLPLITAPADAPSPVVAPAPPPAPPTIQAAAEPAPAPITVTQPIFNADYLENPAPAYPTMSRRMGEQGRVILRVLVAAGGTADEIQVRTTSGHARLDEAASDTVRRWKFVPAKRGDQPVAAWVLIPISFKLEN